MLPLEVTLTAAAVLLMLALAVRSSRRKRRDYQTRNATRKLELVLQPRESVKIICPQKKGRVILTSKRILFENKEGFHALLLKNITKVQGNNEKGNRTTVIANMVSLTIKADQEYEIKNSCPEFSEFAKQLIKKTTKKKNSRS
jgi:hypothetical protein